MPAAALAAWPFLWPSECASHKEWILNLSLETDLHHQSLMGDLSRASGAGRTKAFEAPPCVILAAGTGSLAIPLALRTHSIHDSRLEADVRDHAAQGSCAGQPWQLHAKVQPGRLQHRSSCIVVAWPSSGPSEPAVYTESGQGVTRAGRLPALHDTGSACSTTITLDLVDLSTHQNCVPISGQSRPQTQTLNSLVGSQSHGFHLAAVQADAAPFPCLVGPRAAHILLLRSAPAAAVLSMRTSHCQLCRYTSSNAGSNGGGRGIAVDSKQPIWLTVHAVLQRSQSSMPGYGVLLSTQKPLPKNSLEFAAGWGVDTIPCILSCQQCGQVSTRGVPAKGTPLLAICSAALARQDLGSRIEGDSQWRPRSLGIRVRIHG